MLGQSISDPNGIEEGGSIRGMELLGISTTLLENKTRKQVHGYINKLTGIFEGLTGAKYEGYEIHMGISTEKKEVLDTVVVQNQNVYGSYVHSIFDRADVSGNIIKALAKKKGISLGLDSLLNYSLIKEREFDRLAMTMREYLDMDYIYGILREAAI